MNILIAELEPKRQILHDGLTSPLQHDTRAKRTHGSELETYQSKQKTPNSRVRMEGRSSDLGKLHRGKEQCRDGERQCSQTGPEPEETLLSALKQENKECVWPGG